MRIGGMAGLVLAKLGVVPQQIARRRHLSGAGEGHHRRGRMGRSVRRREARLQQGRQVLLLPGLLGRRPDAARRSSTRRSGTSCRRPTRRRSRRRAAKPTPWMLAKYDAQNPPALRRLVGERHAAAAVPARRCWRRARRRPTRSTTSSSAKSAHFKQIYPQWKKFRDEQFLWFRVAEHTYDNYAFNSQASARRSAARARTSSALSLRCRS